MAMRFDQPVVRRSALPLTERDERDLALLRQETPQRTALMRLANFTLPPDASEGLLLHVLLEVALRWVREEAEASGYAELAEQRSGDAADRRALARRRPPSWTSDE